jgi:ribonucleotide reductase beta subunit family protein with ferritin-like domain
MPAVGSQVSYEDLYARWERGNWRALEIDFTEDRRQWHEVLTEHERRAALWNYAMFFVGEDAVADDLAPFIDAAPREEQKYFLCTQQVDEARHAIFFKRFMEEVVGRGDGSIAGTLRAVEPELTWGFRKTFALLDEITGALRSDRSRVALARAITMYHVVVEALLAQPGQHFISDYLERRDLLPGFRQGMRLVALDEQRHIGFGVKLLHDLAVEEPAVRDAVAELIRKVTPYSLAVFIPPNWDRSYTECFGFTLEEIYTEGARSFEAKLRAAGLPLESLPGPSVFPLEMSAPERAEYALAMLRAGFIGPGNGAPPRDPASMELLFTSVARAVDHRTAPTGPFVVQWEFSDAEPWHVRVDNGSTAAAPGRAAHVDVEVRCRYEDWVDIVAGRLDPRRALATGKLRPHGSPRALWAARSLF